MRIIRCSSNPIVSYKIIVLKRREGDIMRKKNEREGRRVVLCGGVFDILHVGHLKFLEEAKKSGGKKCKACCGDCSR
jgi:bifunctional ADP-heptose synthase (sugar kinase/adenylyltransferase)